MSKEPKLIEDKPSSRLCRINDGLSILVVLLSLYILLWPLLPKILWWTGQTSVTNASPVESPVVKKDAPIPDKNTLAIPKLKMSELVNEGPTIAALRNGVWRRPNTSTPDRGGNTVMVGHRFTYSGQAVFYYLDKLKVGDKITLYWQKKPYYYEVKETKVVPATELSVEANTKEPTLTLYTCTPLWSFKERLVVVAKLSGEPT